MAFHLGSVDPAPGLCIVASSGDPADCCQPAADLIPADWDTRSCLSAAPQMTHQRFWPIEQIAIEEGPNFNETSDHWVKLTNLYVGKLRLSQVN